MITVEKEIWVLIENVVWDFDVRVVAGNADHGRVELFQGLSKDKKMAAIIEVMPPVNGVYRGVDGRTRYAAEEANGAKKILVGVLSPATEAEYTEYAYGANCTGSKPPDFDDLRLTVGRLMDAGKSEKEIKTGPLAAVESSTRLKHACDQERSLRTKRAIAKARVDYVTSDIADPEERLETIAAKYGIRVKALKQAVMGCEGTDKRNTYLNEVKKDLGKIYNRNNVWLRNRVALIQGRAADGTPTDQIFEVYDYMLKQAKANLKVLENARHRFDLQVNGVSGTGVPVKEIVRKKRASAGA
jgi:hypothetical protein